MQRTRCEAINEFLGHVGELGDAEARNLAEAAINRAIESIWMARTWRDFLSPAPIELTLTIDQRSYALPDYFGKVGPGIIRNISQRGHEIEQISMERLQELYPLSGTSLETNGSPCAMAIAGICGVHTQPSASGDALEFVFGDDADNSSKIRVSIEGDDANGRHKRAQFQANGTSAVAIGTWRWIDACGKSYVFGQTPTTEYTTSASPFTLRKVSDQTELQYLFPEESSHEHRVVTFAPKPNAADVITIPCVLRPKRLLFDADALPADWWPAIFERMEADWRSNTGEVGSAASVPRPELTKLIEMENCNGPRPRVRPFGSAVR